MILINRLCVNISHARFIVLEAKEWVLIASLPTSQDHIPGYIEKTHGCIDLPEANFNCYFFKSNYPITDEGWSFPRDTYVYGPQINEFNKDSFNDIYAISGVDYEIIGKLTNDEFNSLINCIKNSKSVKRKIRRHLGANI